MNKNIFFISFEMWGCVFSIIVGLSLIVAKTRDVTAKKLLMGIEFGNGASLLADAFAWLYRGSPSTLGYYMVRISNFSTFLMNNVIILLFTHYLYRYIDRNKKQNRYILYTITVLVALNITLLIVNLFTGFIYTFDENNLYHRGSFFWLNQALGIACILINAYVVIRNAKRMPRSRLLALLSFMVLPIIALIIQTFIYGFSFLNIAMQLSALLMFLSFWHDHSQLLIEKEHELEAMRVNTMISQIQPHFIANALNTIYYLCESDPKKAQECVSHFAKYLRANITSLEATSPIPFSRELEHINEYMKLEKIRFGDRLNIEYDIKTEGFLVPSLSVQCMMENAVKHGVCQVASGGTVRLSTRETDDAFIVEIADNGKGFDPETCTKRVGIHNSRERIRAMVGGELLVQSEEGKGTTVTITIPK